MTKVEDLEIQRIRNRWKLRIKADDSYNPKLIFSLAGVFILILFLWDTPVVYPIKIFVVMIHELSHALATIITGGKVVGIDISSNKSGVCYSNGGWYFLIFSAGYLGSMFWGGVILIIASKTNADKYLTAFIGIIIVIITILYLHTLFNLIYGIAFGIGMIILAIYAPLGFNDFVLKLIGIISVLYSVLIIQDNLISRNLTGSDAYLMSKYYFGNPIFWGVLWIVIAIVALFLIIKIAIK